MNLIALKQINQEQLSGFIDLIASGGYMPFINYLSGVLSGVIQEVALANAVSGIIRTIPSGAVDIYLNYGTNFTNAPVADFWVQSPNVTNGHLIDSYLITGYPTGAYIAFSNRIPSTGYQIQGHLAY